MSARTVAGETHAAARVLARKPAQRLSAEKIMEIHRKEYMLSRRFNLKSRVLSEKDIGHMQTKYKLILVKISKSRQHKENPSVAKKEQF